jgi:hypothetical protein
VSRLFAVRVCGYVGVLLMKWSVSSRVPAFQARRHPKALLGMVAGFRSLQLDENFKLETTHAALHSRCTPPGLILFFDCKLFQMCPSHYSTPAAQNIVEADDPVMLEAVDDQLTPVESGRSCPSSRLSPWMTGL